MLSRRVLIIEDDADAAGVLEAIYAVKITMSSLPEMGCPGWIWRTGGNPI